jgi:hypothetical protein
MSQVKVDFILDMEDEDFPPISVETLNGCLLKDGLIKIDNTPFFVESVAVGDKAKCTQELGKKNYQFLTVVEESGNKAISIIFIDDSFKESIYQYLKKAGCYCEYGEFKGFNMLAVEISSELNYEQIEAYLLDKEERGVLSYAELCI